MNFSGQLARNILSGLLLLLFVATTALAFLTYSGTIAQRGHFWAFAVEHHLWIMAGMAGTALVVGIIIAQMFSWEIEKKEKDTLHILGVVLLFLNREEREVIHFLVKSEGSTSQSEIARLPHMNRVKAHRTLQKLQERDILTVIPHGKVRKVILKENIFSLLKKE